jgi:hypothetical protein
MCIHESPSRLEEAPCVEELVRAQQLALQRGGLVQDQSDIDRGGRMHLIAYEMERESNQPFKPAKKQLAAFMPL